jgi:hypothetical protein
MLNRRNIVPKQWTPALTGVPGPAHLKLVVTGRAGGGGGGYVKKMKISTISPRPCSWTP